MSLAASNPTSHRRRTAARPGALRQNAPAAFRRPTRCQHLRALPSRSTRTRKIPHRNARCLLAGSGTRVQCKLMLQRRHKACSARRTCTEWTLHPHSLAAAPLDRGLRAVRHWRLAPGAVRRAGAARAAVCGRRASMRASMRASSCWLHFHPKSDACGAEPVCCAPSAPCDGWSGQQWVVLATWASPQLLPAERRRLWRRIRPSIAANWQAAAAKSPANSACARMRCDGALLHGRDACACHARFPSCGGSGRVLLS